LRMIYAVPHIPETQAAIDDEIGIHVVAFQTQ
jgi:hypothetical protein